MLGEERVDMVVWDPMTGSLRGLREPAMPCKQATAALVCAADSCDHLDCHGGPFRVVFLNSNHIDEVTWACVYSSESGAWGAPTFIDLGNKYIYIVRIRSVLVGEALYFMQNRGILRYDLPGHFLSAVDLPDEYDMNKIAVMYPDGGGLRLAGVKGHCIYLWSREESPAGCRMGTAQGHRVRHHAPLFGSLPSAKFHGRCRGHRYHFHAHRCWLLHY
ncbi:hypothetical protein ACP70R_015201 [Stipagrostis hirtigluma subsp. patula]